MAAEAHPVAPGSVLIVGAGLAGLFLALKLAPRPCVVLSPFPLGEGSSSAWAQGGLAAALAPDDAPALHAADTEAAGAGLVDPVIAMLIATEGPARVRDLIALGVPFDRTPDGALALSLEAAHSRARVARVAGDLAGKEIMAALIRAARAAPSITIVEGVAADALLHDQNGSVLGVSGRGPHGLVTFQAAQTVLATGGTGGLFRVTTNPSQALGHGLAMAYRAGALVADPEFVQFHPTALDVGRDPAPLATEALRGEGAILVNDNGRAFMAAYHPDADLAPRDIVARAIASEIKAGRGAYLDATKAVGAAFPEHFPTVYAACADAGIDPRTSPIPIAPAAHYHMGGIVTDLWGKTSLPNLSAVGECASTGAHGANRLASNSLLEAVVFADRIATRLRDEVDQAPPFTPPSESIMVPVLPPEALMTLRNAMASRAGVVRDEIGLESLLALIEAMEGAHGPANPLIVARLIASAALQREESRGGHYRSDFPDTDTHPKRTWLDRSTATAPEAVPA
jgi:L-aspartate oxidase